MPRSDKPSAGEGYVICVCHGLRCTAAAASGMRGVMDDLGEAGEVGVGALLDEPARRPH